eukprot:3420470-Amphidinium_carterae.1
MASQMKEPREGIWCSVQWVGRRALIEKAIELGRAQRLSTGESKYYAIAKAARSPGIAHGGKDLGLRSSSRGNSSMPVEIHSDSSAARAFAQRARLGKQKHVHKRLLRIQEQVEQGRIGIRRVGTREADLLTKPLAAGLVKKHVASLGVVKSSTALR